MNMVALLSVVPLKRDSIWESGLSRHLFSLSCWAGSLRSRAGLLPSVPYGTGSSKMGLLARNGLAAV